MKINPVDGAAIVRRTFAIHDGPVCQVPYETAGRRFQPSEVTITYRLDQGAWSVYSVCDVQLSGVRLKADGTPWKGARSSSHWTGTPDYESVSARLFSDGFQWVEKIIEAGRPDTRLPDTARVEL